jgi:hypothetical protein
VSAAKLSLIRDERGKTIEMIIIIGVFVFGIAAGVRILTNASNAALTCHGEQVLNPDGTVGCRGNGGVSAANGTTQTAQNLPRCSGGRCNMCFVAGTPVVTALGLMPIEAVTPGMLVLTRDEHSASGQGDVVWKPVLHHFTSHAKSIVRLSIVAADGRQQSLDTTGNHPFFTLSRGWREAKDLVPGEDRLNDFSGQPLDVVAAETIPGRQTVYNLEVADHHTYFVGNLGVWVHNVGPIEFFNRRRRRTPVVPPAPPQLQDRIPVEIPGEPGREGFRAEGVITGINPDGTFNVSVTYGGRTFPVRGNAQVGFEHMWRRGERTSITLVDGTVHDVLVTGVNPDGSARIVTNTGGQRLIGTLALGHPPRLLNITQPTPPPAVRPAIGNSYASNIALISPTAGTRFDHTSRPDVDAYVAHQAAAGNVMGVEAAQTVGANVTPNVMTNAQQTLAANAPAPIPGDLHFFWAGGPPEGDTVDQLVAWGEAAAVPNSQYRVHLWTEPTTDARMHDPEHLAARQRLQNAGITIHNDVQTLITPALRPYFEQGVRNGAYSLSSDIARYAIIANHGGIYLDADYAPGQVDFTQPPPAMSLNELPMFGAAFRSQSTWDTVEAQLQERLGANPTNAEILTLQYGTGNFSVSSLFAAGGARNNPNTPLGRFFATMEADIAQRLQTHLNGRELGREDRPLAADLTGPGRVGEAFLRVGWNDLGMALNENSLGWAMNLVRRGGAAGANWANLQWVTPASDDTFDTVRAEVPVPQPLTLRERARIRRAFDPQTFPVRLPNVPPGQFVGRILETGPRTNSYEVTWEDPTFRYEGMLRHGRITQARRTPLEPAAQPVPLVVPPHFVMNQPPPPAPTQLGGGGGGPSNGGGTAPTPNPPTILDDEAYFTADEGSDGCG